MIIDYFKTIKTVSSEMIQNNFPEELFRNNAVVRLGKSDFESLFYQTDSLDVTILESVPTSPIPEGDMTIYEASDDTSMEELEKLFSAFDPACENPLLGIYTSSRPGIRCAVFSKTKA